MNSGQNKMNLTASVMKQLEGDSVHGFGFAQSRSTIGIYLLHKIMMWSKFSPLVV